ncbi:MAG: GvpL/GvpF family gas vesicle protein [Bacillota bacterium]
MTKTAKYLYGIIPLGEKTCFDMDGIDNNSEVYTITHKDISAVVSDVEAKIFDPTRENVLAHNMIISTIMEKFSIIPAKFGTVFTSSTDVEIFLEKIYSTSLNILDEINNKVEFGLKVFWTEESFAELIDTKDVRELHNKTKTAQHKDNSYLKMELGMLVKDIADDKRAYYLKEIHEKIAKISFKNKLNENIGAKMVFNAAYLVKKQKVDEFQETVGKLIDQHKDTLEVKFTGPWPPYNFTAMKIKIKR